MGATDLSVLPQRSVVFPETVFRGLAAADVPLRVEGVVGQTGNLFETRNSDGTAITRISSAGTILMQNATGLKFDGGAILTSGTSGGTVIATPANATSTGFIVKGLASQSNPLQDWQDSAGNTLTRVFPSGTISTAQRLVAGDVVATAIGGAPSIASSSTAADRPAAVFRAAVSQTANIQEWQNSAGSILSYVASNGWITAPGFAVNGGDIQFVGTTRRTIYPVTAGNIDLQIRSGGVGTLQLNADNNGPVYFGGGTVSMEGSLKVIQNTANQGQNNVGLLVGNDLWIYDVNVGNSIGFSGVGNPEVARLYLGRVSNSAPFINGNDVNKTIEFGNTGGGTSIPGPIYMGEVSFGTNTNGRMRMGQSDPNSYTLGIDHAASGQGYIRAVSHDNVERAYLRWDGHWFAAGYNGISAEATKDDIRTLSVANFPSQMRASTKSLSERFKSVRPVDFAPKAGMEGERRMLSFVAEELSEVLPEATAYDNDGNPAGVNLNAMITILTAMVQDQQKRIEDLEANK